MNRNKIFLMNNAINRKKIYKSGKQWVVESTLALLLLGGVEVINHHTTYAHADTTQVQTKQPISNVGNQAKDLHHAIINSTNSHPQIKTPKANNSNVTTKPDLSNNVNSYNSTKHVGFGTTLNKSQQHIGQPQPSDNHWIADVKQSQDQHEYTPTGRYLSDNDIHNWQKGTFDGANWQFNYDKCALEFTNGTFQNTNDFHNLLNTLLVKIPSGEEGISSRLASIKFDNGVDTSKISDMQNLFASPNIAIIDLPTSFDTSNVNTMGQMFNTSKLKSLILPKSFDTRKAIAGKTISDKGGSDIGDGLYKMFNPSLQQLTIQSPNTKFTKDSGLLKNWYQRIGNSNYTSTTPVNLMDGGSHVGTWSTTATPAPPEAAPYGVVYLNQNKTEVGEATLNNLGYVGQVVNIEPELAQNVPSGYHLINTKPINVTLNNGGIINVNTSNELGATNPIHHGLLGNANATNNHVITVDGNPITYKGNVTLNFKTSGKTIKTITKSYSVNTYTGDTVNLLNPSNYLNGSNLIDNNDNPIIINSTYFQPDNNNNVETITVQPSDAPKISGNTKTNNNYVLNYNANKVSDNITYDLSGNNVPSNYQRQTGRMNSTSLPGTYDTNIPLSDLNNDVPTNYHIVSGNNIRYDGKNHTVELAPNSENVKVIYTDQNGHTYTGLVNGQYNQKINDITTKYSLPNGYHVNDGQDKSYTFSGNQNQLKTLSITGDIAGTINGSQNKNTPKNAKTGYVTIHVIEKSTNGKVLHRFDIPISENNKRVGDNYTIKPSDTDIQPPYYDVANGDNPLTGTVNNDGNLSNGQTTYTYTVHASDIEPISITIKNQNGHYIDVNTGKLTDSANNATSTISDNTLAQLGGIRDAVDITPYINAPKGYHFNGDKSALEDSTGQKLDAIILEHKESGFGVMPLMLTMWTPTPNSINSNKSNNPKTSSTSNCNSSLTKPASINNNIITSSSSTSQSNSNDLPNSTTSQSTSSSALTNPIISIPISASTSSNNYINTPSTSNNIPNKNTNTSNLTAKASNITTRSIPITTRNASLNKTITPIKISNLVKPLTTPINFGSFEPTTTPLVQSNSTNNTHNELPQTNESNNYVDVVGLIISIMSLGIAGIELNYYKFH